MGILGEQSILSQLGGYIKESVLFENYSLVPVGEEYDSEENVSFMVHDGDTHLASVKVFKVDGEPVNAVGETYNYDDVYADVTSNLEGKEDEYDTEAVKNWTLGKLATMGFDKNPVKYDGEEYNASEYKEEVSDEPDELEDVKDDVEDIEGDEFSLDDLEDENLYDNVNVFENKSTKHPHFKGAEGIYKRLKKQLDSVAFVDSSYGLYDGGVFDGKYHLKNVDVDAYVSFKLKKLDDDKKKKVVDIIEKFKSNFAGTKDFSKRVYLFKDDEWITLGFPAKE